MDTLRLTEADLANIQQNMSAFYSQDADRVVEISVEELVTITMDGRFQVREVRIQRLRESDDDIRSLERAVLTAVNDAVREVARLNGERLTRTIRELRDLTDRR
jgi:DNA-binding protein YbaB